MRRALLIGLSVLPVAPVLAQPYPDKPITLVVPALPGGAQDIFARVIAGELSKTLGQKVAISNQSDRSPIAGTLAARSAAPDGYTLLSVSNAFARIPGLVRDAGYDALADFAPVSPVSRMPMVLVTTPGFAGGSVAELITLAKTKPAALRFGTTGNASIGHVAAEMFMRHVGARMQHVSFRSSRQMHAGLTEGQVDLMFEQLILVGAQVKAGKLHAIAVTTRTRAALLPDVPTLHDSGLLGFEDHAWTGVVAPAGTSSAIILRLHAEIARVLGNPVWQKRFLDLGVELKAGASPDEFSAFIKTEVAEFAKLVIDTGMKAD